MACLGSDAAPCARAAACLTLPVWQGLDRVINQYLDGVTIADLLRQASAGNGGVI